MNIAKKLLLIIGTATLIGQANASIVSHAAVNGLNTFQDTTTGLVWLQLPDLFGMDYATQVATANAAGFTVADFATIRALNDGSAFIHADLGNWSAIAAIIGSSATRALMWGNYSDGASNGWEYAYSNTQWLHYNPGTSAAFSDLGLWAFQSRRNDVPEPGTIALLGLGLLGLSKFRRKSTK